MNLTLTAIALTVLCHTSAAQLRPLNDDSLSLITGQSMIKISDNTHTLDSGSLQKHTRIDLGLDIDLMATVDKAELGRYSRPGTGAAADGAILPADIIALNLGMGKINSRGEIEAFQIEDPYIEIATEKSADGIIDIFKGLRVGAKSIRGHTVGDLISLSGNVTASIKDTTFNVDPALGFIILSGNLEMTANLTDSLGNVVDARASTLGVPTTNPIKIFNPARGFSLFGILILNLFVGLPNGNWLNCVNDDCSQVTSYTNNTCGFLGRTTCFPLIQNSTLNIGQQHSTSLGHSGKQEWINGAYLSIQSKRIQWHNSTGASTTPSGFAVNIPAGAVNVNVNEGQNGTLRDRIKYIDPYVGNQNNNINDVSGWK
jgi:hypothetical protein